MNSPSRTRRTHSEEFKHTSVKTSIKTKRLLAATSDEFRAALLELAIEVDDDEED